MASRDTKLNIIVNAQDRTKRGLDGAQKGLRGMQDQLRSMQPTFQKMAVAGGAAFAAIGMATRSFIKEAAEAERVVQTFETLTKTINSTSTSSIDALRKATRGLVDDTNLMMSGNRLISMGLAQTEQEMANLSEMAVTLGSAMGKDATMAMEDFALMLANQSILRLDTFGISGAKVRERILELTESVEGMTRETAFMQAVMEEGGKSMERLGTMGTTTGEDIQAFQASMSNLRQEVGNALIPIMLRILEVVEPIITKIIDWVEKNPKLTATIIAITLAAAGLVTVLGLIGLALPAIIGALALFSGTAGIVIGVMAGLGLAVTQVVRIVRLLQESWSEVWLGIKLITIDAANGVIGIVEKMINGVINKINSFIERINRIVRKASQITGRDIPTLGTLDTVSLGRIDPQSTIDRSLANQQGGQSQLVITGNNFLSEDAAEQFGDQIMSKLKLSNAI